MDDQLEQAYLALLRYEYLLNNPSSTWYELQDAIEEATRHMANYVGRKYPPKYQSKPLH